MSTSTHEEILFVTGQTKPPLGFWDGLFTETPFTGESVVDQASNLAMKISIQGGVNIAIGYSAGCNVLGEAIKSCPGLVKHMVWVCPAPPRGMDLPLYIKLIMLSRPRKYLWEILTGGRFVLEKQHAMQLLGLSESEYEAIAPHMEAWYGSVVREMMIAALLCQKPDWKAELSSLESFTIISGEEDGLINAKLIQAIVAMLRKQGVKVNHIVIPGMGHMPFLNPVHSKMVLEEIGKVVGYPLLEEVPQPAA